MPFALFLWGRRELAGIALGKRAEETHGSLVDRVVDKMSFLHPQSAQGAATGLHVLAFAELYLLEMEKIEKFCGLGSCACDAGGKGEPPGSIRVVPAAPSPAAWAVSPCPHTTRLCVLLPPSTESPLHLGASPGKKGSSTLSEAKGLEYREGQ